jgi:hypothetical protein
MRLDRQEVANLEQEKRLMAKVEQQRTQLMEYEARVMQHETQILELKDRIAAMGKELEVAKQTDNEGKKEEQLVREHQGSEER